MENESALTKQHILAVDDDVEFLEELSKSLSKDYDLFCVNNASEAMAALKAKDYDCLLLDMNLPEIDGLQLLRILKGLKPSLPIIMLTGEKSITTVVRAMKEGAYDYVVKEPGNLDVEIKFKIKKAIQQQQLVAKAQTLEKKISEENSLRYEIIGHSPKILSMKGQIQALKGNTSPVLIYGESGTGKELIARALNIQEKNGTTRPLICVNCAAIPENLAESELFGHVKGSFTGAHQQQDGKFLAANGGDIFLDEIGELSLTIQAKLLRVLQEKEVVRVGSNNSIKLNVRVIAATHRDLSQAVTQGKFREDLYYRLTVMSLSAPALKERKSDIPLLVEHFLKDMKSHLRITKEALELLENHNWPGNIRALRNCIERAKILADTDGGFQIGARHIILDHALTQAKDNKLIQIPWDLLPQEENDINSDQYKSIVEWVEKIYFQKSFEIIPNKSKIAEQISRSRNFVHGKFRDLGISEGEV